jgi:hypothetical protein
MGKGNIEPILGIIFATFIAIIVVVAAIFIPRTLKLDREATACSFAV